MKHSITNWSKPPNLPCEHDQMEVTKNDILFMIIKTTRGATFWHQTPYQAFYKCYTLTINAADKTLSKGTKPLSPGPHMPMPTQTEAENPRAGLNP